MIKKLISLEKQIKSLEGANLEISVSSGSNFSKEIETFLQNYSGKDFVSLSRL